MLYETNVANVAMQNDNAIIVVVSISIRTARTNILNKHDVPVGRDKITVAFVITKTVTSEVTRLNLYKNLLG